MENPASWNNVMKAINRFHWDYKTANDEVASNLINSLDAEGLLTSKPQALHSVVLKSLEHHVEMINEKMCGHSIGAAMYYKLKAIGAVE
jgi:hypothetical protein